MGTGTVSESEEHEFERVSEVLAIENEYVSGIETQVNF
jgi:hypothetical protein